MTAFDTLQHHYAERLAAAHQAHTLGTPVVGIIGNTVPREHTRSIALSGSRYATLSEQMHIPGWRRVGHMEAKRHRVDGGLSLGGWWGQRIIIVALEEEGIRCLDFPVDPVDANSWDDAKMSDLVSQFIETRVAPARARRP